MCFLSVKTNVDGLFLPCRLSDENNEINVQMLFEKMKWEVLRNGIREWDVDTTYIFLLWTFFQFNSLHQFFIHSLTLTWFTPSLRPPLLSTWFIHSLFPNSLYLLLVWHQQRQHIIFPASSEHLNISRDNVRVTLNWFCSSPFCFFPVIVASAFSPFSVILVKLKYRGEMHHYPMLCQHLIIIYRHVTWLIIWLR